MPYIRAIGVAWFRPEDYQRIREISDDEMIDTFEEFEAKMAARLPQIAASLGDSVILEKVVYRVGYIAPGLCRQSIAKRVGDFGPFASNLRCSRAVLLH